MIDIIEAKADAPLWYLLKLYYFCLFAPIVGFVVKMTKWSILLMPFLGVVGYCYSSYTGLLFWLPFLLLGCWLNYYCSIVTIPIRYRKISLLVLILILVVFLSSFNSYNDQFTVLYYIYRQITPIILIGVYMNYDLIPYKAVDLVGPYSMFIYCTHIQLLYPVSKLLVFIPQPVHYVLKVVIVVAILVQVGFFLRKSKKVWGVINGGR